MRAVTERDFRRPEFMEANPEDYEFRADGEIVRKDRWEMGFRRIVSIAGCCSRDFEIDDVVATVDHRLNHPMTVVDDNVIEAVRYCRKDMIYFSPGIQKHLRMLNSFVETTLGISIEENPDA